MPQGMQRWFYKWVQKFDMFGWLFFNGLLQRIASSCSGDRSRECYVPFAYAICGKENTETWKQFCDLLKSDLDIEMPELYTMMSDRQKGLDSAVGTILS